MAHACWLVVSESRYSYYPGTRFRDLYYPDTRFWDLPGTRFRDLRLGRSLDTYILSVGLHGC